MKEIINAIVLTLVVSHSIAAPPKKPTKQPELQDIEIKGIKLGMSFNEVAATIAANPGNRLTIGGIFMKGLDGKPFVKYDDNDRMISFYFQFEPSEFDNIANAVRSKYPSLNCNDSQIQNRMGASFTQTDCRLSSVTGLMTISRYSGSIENGSLMIMSREAIKAESEKSKKKESDI